MKFSLVFFSPVASTVLLLVLFINSYSSPVNDTIKYISVEKITGTITIDGDLSEPEWQTESTARDFTYNAPTDQGTVINTTEVSLAYNDQFLYIAAICYFQDFVPIVQSLKRDSPWSFSDSFTFVVDPSGNQTSGMLFNVSAGNTQVDAIINTQGIFSSIDTNWDTQWYSKAKVYQDRWVVEMAIPFQMLRYNQKNKNWSVNFIRHDMQNTSTTCWSHVPVNYDNFNLQHVGRLIWNSSPPPFTGMISLAPFVTSGGLNTQGTKSQLNVDAGLDGKVALNTNLNLDFTINPDFSQTDVDQQVINLSRFDISFPEKRIFFQENSDLFSSMGIPSIRPFFSRKIGLKNGVPLPLLGGLRLTGNLNPKLRVGLLSVIEESVKDTLYKTHSAGAFQQTLNKNSQLQGIFTSIDVIDKFKLNEFDYNRSVGLEYKYFTNNRNWNFALRYHNAFRSNITNNRQYAQIGVTHNIKHWYIDLNWMNLQKNYINDLGFTPRLYQFNSETSSSTRVGYQRTFTEFLYRIFPTRNNTVAFHGPHILADTYFRFGSELNESNIALLYEIKYKNRSSLSIGIRNNYAFLLYPTRLIGAEFENLPAGSYRFQNIELQYESPPTAKLRYSFRGEYGSFYNGTRLTLSPGVGIRWQSWSNFLISYDINRIEFPGIYGKREIHLIGSNVEIFFSNTMFWTTFFQYNTQINNVNLNSRFQWRFRPLSDLFIIYSENYTDSFISKNRGLVVKLVYWFRANSVTKQHN